MRNFLTLLFILSALCCTAQYGMPDPTFGVNGVATGGLNGFQNFAYAVAVQPDRKVLLAGDIEYDQNSTYIREWALTRYNADGTIDQSFGNNGSDTTNFSQAWNSCSAINLLPDGRILLGGYAEGNVTLVRYMPDGSLDMSFGSDGVAMFSVSSGGYNVSVKVMADGSIIAACPAFSGVGSGYSYTFLRADSNGLIDHTFGTDGVTYVGDGHNNWYCNDIAVLCDGSILATGTASTPFSFATMRINSDGTQDHSFGHNGFTTTTFSGTIEADGNAIAVRHDGRIVVAGTLVSEGSFTYALAQYLSDGQPDRSFGNNGIAIANFVSGDDQLQRILLQADEKILVSSGVTGIGGGGTLARWNTDGSPDLTFGNGGQSEVLPGTATGIAIAPDGKILQAGYTWFPFNTKLLRFTSDVGTGPADTCPPPARWVLPTAFTPNGDSLNNTYYVLADGPLRSFQLNISNRWGELVFSSSDITVHWDGTYQGMPQPEGVYFCFLCAEDYDGHRSCQSKAINLLR